MREHEKAFVVCIRSMRLNLYGVLFKQLPVLAVFERRFYKNAVLVSRKVLPANNLTNKVDFRLKISPGSHLVSHGLQLVELLLLHLLQSMSLIV